MTMSPAQRCFTGTQMILCYRPWTRKRRILICLCLPLWIIITVMLVINFWTLEIWPWYPAVNQWCDQEKVEDFMLHSGSSSNEITIVTMFLDLGIFKKGEQTFAYHSPYKYRRWMRVFGRVANPVLAYMESDQDVEYFRKIRSCVPSSLTKIIQVKRTDLTSFQKRAAISAIYSQPSYPKHFPNTVYPDYSCAMNAKYDVLAQACQMDAFHTPYIAWVDIGLFRKLDGANSGFFKIAVPPDFNADHVAFSQAWPQFPDLPVKQIMHNKLVWVSGSMVLATKQVMLDFTKMYQEAVVELLNKGLANTDQEVIHAMYTTEMRKPNQIKIQAYTCEQGQYGLWGSDARYFCLGYRCRDAWRQK